MSRSNSRPINWSARLVLLGIAASWLLTAVLASAGFFHR